LLLRPGAQAWAEWRSHWPVVLSACAAVGMTTINTYSMGLFIDPFEREFGWTRAEITAGPAIAAVMTIVLGPFMGAAVDRMGPRRIGIVGLIALGVLTASLGLCGPSIMSWLGIWTLLALMNVFLLPNVWTAAITGLFSGGRGLALAVTLCGSSIASIVTPLLTYYLIGRFGWRWAFVGLAASWSVIVIPLVLLFFTSARDQERVRQRAPVVSRADRLSIAVRRDMLSYRFIKMAIGVLLIAGVVVSFVVSLVPILSWSGISRGQAASIAALVGFSSIAGRLTIGVMLDHLPGRILAAVAVFLPVLSASLLIAAPGSASAATAAVLILGLSLGAELDLVAYLTSRYFDVGNFGFLFGTLAGIVTLAGGGGPMLLSEVYDHTHSYLPGLWAAIPMCLVSASLFLTLGPYPASPNLKSST
jgi:MFS family permease